MNEPKRLLMEAQSPLASELLRAAAEEEMPSDLRVRMASYLVGAGALGADAGLAQKLGGPAPNTSATAGPSTVQPLSAGLKAAAWTKAGAALLVAGAVGGLGYLLTGGHGPEVAPLAAPAAREVALELAPEAAAPTAVSMREAASNARGVNPALTVDAPVNADPARRSAPANAAPVRRSAPANADPARRSAPAKAEAPLVEKEPKASVQRGVAEEPEVAGRAKDLDGELRLLDAARRAIVKGEIDTARSYLKDYQGKFPTGTLTQEAAALLERTRATE